MWLVGHLHYGSFTASASPFGRMDWAQQAVWGGRKSLAEGEAERGDEMEENRNYSNRNKTSSMQMQHLSFWWPQ